ncbi:PilZ domain-containing protein [Cellulomonas sp. zg-ZUI222]|uniref:PilZ domain-containing protein n=1 Tax=Cellulomonas wangleii TaxID=2816956 RepID=A0ABX8D0M7_9CELL|nr:MULTISPECIES: PilZ domain-containing protein [Cellulomonas]MBO0900056.1 PilZ domain-containing protein [Cellulomonas sp. zg-ZUI22]MBO0921029.1 PilZ domain-containing protein [Cellulomonas wangleii]MBO0925489.1 PilZ domain-containing protein [Cellulomonas wangleii]QVI61040.1 PilZ domain-containing protein [Cellulomonas wangleii]
MHELAVCTLRTKSGDVDGHVVSFDAGVLVLEVDDPVEDREIGDAASVTVLDPVRGLCRYVGLLGGTSGTAVQLVVLERGVPDQRRSAARALYRTACTGKVESPSGVAGVSVTVVDISASGVRFVTSRSLSRGDVVRFPMPAGDTTVDLAARVLRVEEGQHEWRYGCELVDLDDRTRETLFRLVLSLQRAAARERSLAAW